MTSTASCHICGSSSSRVYELPAFSVRRCKSCGILYRDPLPSAEEVLAMYEDHQYHDSAYFADQLDPARATRGPEVPIYRDGLEWLERNIPGDGRSRSLLDVGSGAGLFLALAGKRGWEVEGVEISPSLAEASARAHDVRVHCGEFREISTERRRFDAITMWDLLEHVDDPRATLRHARSLLKTQGYLVVFTINSASLFNGIAHLGYKITGGLLSLPVELLYDRRHNFYFTMRTLESTLVSCGFRVCSRGRYRAHLDRWVAEPISQWLMAGSKVVDIASSAIGQHYRQILFCSPTSPARRT